MYHNKFMTLFDFCGKFGLKNTIYFQRVKKHPRYGLPLKLPVFGLVTHKEEILNIRDNIFQGSLRDPLIEKELREAEAPVIVDCGINVGVTVRWWLYLNAKSTVYGVDMMQEAHDFTVKSLPESLKKNYFSVTAALAAESGSALEVKFNDPLFGGNSIAGGGECAHRRSVRLVTLDDCLRGHSIPAIDLLKVDIEGSGVPMFRGAVESLKKVKNIFLEWHDDEERQGSITFLKEAGFVIRKAYKRHFWFMRNI
ncbi:MAG TPA: FkbM family methyltransferase [Candidatus Omnitrophota bacterium]|nr:FkbM family methyltransferase [Candidatus Omnitrophota bacterium]HPS36330.1 FkbM family methyltransferase [Candidatus Omnitrophota bacterium]